MMLEEFNAYKHAEIFTELELKRLIKLRERNLRNLFETVSPTRKAVIDYLEQYKASKDLAKVLYSKKFHS